MKYVLFYRIFSASAFLLLMLAPFGQTRLFEIGVLAMTLLSPLVTPRTLRLPVLESLQGWGVVLLFIFLMASLGQPNGLGNAKELLQLSVYFLFWPILLRQCLAEYSSKGNYLYSAIFFGGVGVILIHLVSSFMANVHPEKLPTFPSDSSLGLYLSILLPLLFAHAALPGCIGRLSMAFCFLGTMISSSACTLGIMLAFTWIMLTQPRKYLKVWTSVVILQGMLYFWHPVGISPIREVGRDLAFREQVDNEIVVRQRFIEAYAALKLLLDQPLRGVGPDNYQRSIGTYYGFLPKNNTMERDTQCGWLVLGSVSGLMGVIALGMIYRRLITLAPLPGAEASSQAWQASITGVGWALTLNTFFSYPLVAGVAPMVSTLLVLADPRTAQYLSRVRNPITESPEHTKRHWRAVFLTCSLLGVLSIGFSAGKSLLLKDGKDQKQRLFASQYDQIESPMRFVRQNDESYVEIPPNSGKGWQDGTGGLVSYILNISEPGTYAMWAETWWLDGCSNSFDVLLTSAGHANGPAYAFGNDARYQQWHWVRGATYTLDKGSYEIKIANREDGFKLRQLLFSNQLSFEEHEIAQLINDQSNQGIFLGQTNEPEPRRPESFFEGFAGCDKNIAGYWKMQGGQWKIVNATNLGTVGADDALLQISPDRAMAYLEHPGWKDYSFSLQIFPTSEGGWGAGFYAIDDKNYYLLRAARAESSLPYADTLQLVKCVDGMEQVLDQQAWQGELDQWHVVEVRGEGGYIKAAVDDVTLKPILNAANGQGKVFLFSEECPGVYFDNVRVEFNPKVE